MQERSILSDGLDVRARGVLALSALAVVLAVMAGAAYGRIIDAGLYPLFHLVAELIGIVVASATFMVAWNARRTIDNGYFLVVGTAYVWMALVDLLHALSYRGVGLITVADTDFPTQLWLVGRYLQAAAWLAAPAFVRRRVRPAMPLVAWGMLTAILLASIMWWHVFPAAFVEGAGLTPFKVASEYVIALAMLAGLVLLARERASFDPRVFASLAVAIGISIVAELAFTLYNDPFGPANYIGHLLRIVAFVLLYRALVEGAIERPFDVLFRQVSTTADALRRSEAMFRSMFEQATLGIMHISAEGRIVRANRRMSELAGRGREALESMPAEELTDPADRITELELAEALADGRMREYRLEKRLLKSDGEAMWVNASRSVVRDEDGRPLHYTEIVEDISLRRAALERSRRQRDLSSALAAIDRAVNSTFDIEEIMRRVVAEGGAAIAADSASVVMREGDRWVARHTWRFPEDITGETFTDEELPHAAEAARTSAPVAIQDAYTDSRVNEAVMRRFGIRSVIAIPMAFRSQQLGTLYFNFHKTMHHFDEDEVDFSIQLSAALTLAIENARLFAAERDTVDTLQSALLRIETELPRITVATAYHSAQELTRIGGDFYDVFAVPDSDRVAFVVGDVAGKGLAAAALTAIAKSTIRAFAYEWDEPSRVLAAANNVLLRQVDEGRFITVVYGVLDTATGLTRMVCAGHPAPLVCDRAGCRDEDIRRNPPLAVFEDALFEEFTTFLEIGDRMVLFSDGLIDARHDVDFLGEQGVRDLIDELGDADPEHVVERLLDAARRKSRGSLPDDIALVVFRYLGPDVETPE